MKLEMKDYMLVEKIGSGSYGTVYLCLRNSDSMKCVVKEVHLDETNDEECQAALEEVRILSSLSHPNVIGYVDCELRADLLLIVMDLAECGSLHEMLQARQNQPLPFDEVMSIFVQVVLGLEHVHSQHVLHRDLTAKNVLLGTDGNGRTTVKLADFGIARLLQSRKMASTQVGTHWSPELCQGVDYDTASDVWALGCVFYQTLTFRDPFPATNLVAMARKVMQGSYQPVDARIYPAPGLAHLVASLLTTDPRERITICGVQLHPVAVPHFMLAAANLGRIV